MLLAIETSTSRSSVALADPADGSVLAASELGRDRRHGEFVAPAIAELLHHLGATVTDLTAVAAGIGPGLYTGLRVGLVTASTLATTRRLPCVGVVGPDAVAHGLRFADRDVLVALDARRRELYLARYRPTTVGDAVVATPVGDLAVVTPADAASTVRSTGTPVLLAGDGTPALVAALADAAGDPSGAGGAVPPQVRLAGPAHAQPTAAGLVPLAVAALTAGEVGGPEVLRPLYLREADARIGWDQRGRLRGGAAPA